MLSLLLSLTLHLHATASPSKIVVEQKGVINVGYNSDTTNSRPRRKAHRRKHPLHVASSTCWVTAYCLKGRTASGGWVHEGIVAHHSLPFGTRVLIDGKGPFVVMDRGPRGVIDIWVRDCAEARKLGRRKVWVQVISRCP